MPMPPTLASPNSAPPNSAPTESSDYESVRSTALNRPTSTAQVETVTAATDEVIATPNDLYLQIGDFYFGSGPSRLRTVLGSCVSVTLWHPTLRLGGMCHFLLPEKNRATGHDDTPAGAYADQAIQRFVDEIRQHRTHPREYVTKIFGGGNMFPQQIERRCRSEVSVMPLPAWAGMAENCSQCRTVSCHNVATARHLLNEYGFNVSREHVGGVGSRQLILDLRNGNTWVRHNPPGNWGATAIQRRQRAQEQASVDPSAPSPSRSK